MKFKIFWISLAFLLAQPLAWANFIGNDTENFNPLPSGVDFITVHSSETLANGILNTGLFVNYAKNSLPYTINGTGQRVSSNDSVTFSDFSLAYGLADRWDVGLSVSDLLSQETDRDEPGAQFAGTGLNEIRFMTKYTLVPRAPVGVALIASFNVNESINNPFNGNDSGPTTNIEAAADYRLGDNLIAGNIGYRFRENGPAIPDAVYQPLPNQYLASVAINHYFPKANLKAIGEIYAAKPTTSVAYINANQISSEFLAGLKYDASRNAAVQAGFGSRIGGGLFTPDWRVYIGVNLTFDLLHKPAAVVVAATEEKPPVVTQNTSTTNLYRGYQPADIIALKNTPFDDITKTHEFQLITAVPELNFKGEKPPFEVIRLDGFDFDSGSAKIRPEYYAMMDRLISYLDSKPKVIKIRIEGHTDSLGNLGKNKTLSQERSNAMRAYFKNKNILPEIEVESAGFGADRPIADNSNFQGRKANRRVEIRILRELPEVAPEKVEKVTTQSQPAETKKPEPTPTPAATPAPTPTP